MIEYLESISTGEWRIVVIAAWFGTLWALVCVMIGITRLERRVDAQEKLKS